MIYIVIIFFGMYLQAGIDVNASIIPANIYYQTLRPKFGCILIVIHVTFVNEFASIIGCASSIVSVTSLGITADLIGDHTKHGAFVYGMMSFGDKISNGVAVMIIQYL